MERKAPMIQWEQLALIPPSTWRVEVVVFIDGPTEDATIGWKVTDANSDEVMALGVDRPIPMSMGLSRAVDVLTTYVQQACATVSPF